MGVKFSSGVLLEFSCRRLSGGSSIGASVTITPPFEWIGVALVFVALPSCGLNRALAVTQGTRVQAS